jgi:cytochrome c-type biogenesis protein CcmH/NrfG
MEYVEGQTLAHLIQARPAAGQQPAAAHDATRDYAPDAAAAPTAPAAALSTRHGGPPGREFYRTAARLIAQAADALDHAHSLGIVHRDVKPGNLLLNPAGRVYVSDFGLARCGPDAGLTMSGDLLGTLRYMAPEQALARHGLADHRVDVYGLGATLYELLTGRPAVDATDRAEVLRKIAFEEPTAPRKLDKAIPAELETVTLKCLAKNPAERYATAGELADDLRRWLTHQTIRAKPPSVRQRAAKWALRHKPVVGAAIAVAIVVVAALAALASFAWYKNGQLEQAYAAMAQARAWDLITLGSELMSKGRWDEVFPALHEAIRLKPDLAEAHLALGIAYCFGKCDWDGTDVACREALRLNPNLIRAPILRAVALREKGHGLWEKGDRDRAHATYREAREVLEDAQRRVPDRPEVVHNLAFFLATCMDERLRDTGRAVELSKRKAARWPGDSGSWSMLGITLYRAGHALDAIPALERALYLKAVQQNHDFLAWEYFYLALAYRQLGDLYRSTLYYAAGVRWVEQHAPANTEFRRMRAYAAAQLGITDAAHAGTQPQAETESKTQDSRPSNP